MSAARLNYWRTCSKHEIVAELLSIAGWLTIFYLTFDIWFKFSRDRLLSCTLHAHIHFTALGIPNTLYVHLLLSQMHTGAVSEFTPTPWHNPSENFSFFVASLKSWGRRMPWDAPFADLVVHSIGLSGVYCVPADQLPLKQQNQCLPSHQTVLASPLERRSRYFPFHLGSAPVPLFLCGFACFACRNLDEQHRCCLRYSWGDQCDCQQCRGLQNCRRRLIRQAVTPVTPAWLAMPFNGKGAQSIHIYIYEIYIYLFIYLFIYLVSYINACFNTYDVSNMYLFQGKTLTL